MFSTASHRLLAAMVRTIGSISLAYESRFQSVSSGRPVMERLANEKTKTMTSGRAKNAMR